jgi:hypothetical protein
MPWHADCVARGVHHDEHGLEAAVLLADQVADGAAVVAVLQHRRRAGLDASLCSMLTQCTSLRSPSGRRLGQQTSAREQRDALHSFRGAGHAREHQVDDVVRHVVLAVGDEDLGAEDLVAAVGLRLGAGAHQRQVAAGLRLGEVHRAGPLAGDELGQVELLLLLGAGVSSASMAPSVSSGHSAKLRLALLSISIQAAAMVLGRPWPPKSAGC